MNRYVWITTVVIVFTVLLMPLFTSLGIRFLPNDKQPSLERTRGVFWIHEISQEFVSENDNLIGIGMSIKNPNLKNKKDITLSLYEGEKLLRISTLNGSIIEDGSFMRFMFEDIVEASGRDYRFILSAPEGRSEDLLAVFTTEEKPEWIGRAVYDEEEIDDGISMVTFHRPESRWGLIKEIYGGWIDRLVADTGFSVGYGIALVVLVALVVI